MGSSRSIPAPILVALGKAPLVMKAVVEIRHARIIVAFARLQLGKQSVHKGLMRGHAPLKVGVFRLQVIEYFGIGDGGVAGVL